MPDQDPDVLTMEGSPSRPRPLASSSAAVHLPVYVIRALEEQNEHARGEFARAGLAFKWITGFDADDLTLELDRRYFSKGAPLTPSQKSRALKHVAAMRCIRNSGADRAFVLEDHMVLCPDFVTRIEATLTEADRDRPRPNIPHLGAAILPRSY